ncbi:KRAB domain-containing zinc finger protein [Sarotherodon galilaeus]
MKKKKQQHARHTKNQHKKLKIISVNANKWESESFLDELIRWFSDHQQQINQLFIRGDADRSGSVSLKDFELGLMSLGVPCQQFQLHTLTQQLKTFNDMISYQDLMKQIQSLSHSAEPRAQIPEDFIKRQEPVKTENLKHQQRWQNTETQRFIRLSVRLIPFTSSTVHPGNFEVVLSSSRTVFGLMSVIEDRAGIHTSSLEVFSSRVPTEEARLPLESTLEECGFKGGPEERPPEATVYYDYRLPFTDCPILNYDHYIRSKQDSTSYRGL